MSETLEKISALENALMQVAYAQRKTDINLSQLSMEMKEFKDEMKDFKDEMIIFKNESQTDRKNMNKQWGDLANKLGTIVEDIVAPQLAPHSENLFCL